MSNNGINNKSFGLTIGNMGFNTNTLASTSGDLTIASNASNSIFMKNGVTTLLKFDASGRQTIPQQCGFIARRTTNQTDVTGDGTVFVPTFTAEPFDTGSNYSDPTFTAPVTGKYYFSVFSTFTGIIAAMLTGTLKLITSNRTYTKYWNPFNTYTDSGSLNASAMLFTVADMDSGDTATISSTISGSTKTADFRGFAIIMSSHFNGVLIS